MTKERKKRKKSDLKVMKVLFLLLFPERFFPPAFQIKILFIDSFFFKKGGEIWSGSWDQVVIMVCQAFWFFFQFLFLFIFLD